MNRPNPERESQAVIEFNHLNRVGANVIVKLDNGTKTQTKTRSEAWLMGGHSAVVLLEGVSGAYSLHRVTVVETETQRTYRLAGEAETAKRAEVARLESEIEVLQDRLKSLLTP